MKTSDSFVVLRVPTIATLHWGEKAPRYYKQGEVDGSPKGGDMPVFVVVELGARLVG
ncbi:hypothetical protein [Pajaroellobacter abortibovis]|uniref:hypothetical protein n=1 Tax=Pajaroellobacter abortibovis TaxID=1882918 RepID=UPI0012EC055A|nr:hypothetical protein [Pajaroellobacter abortibovis]